LQDFAKDPFAPHLNVVGTGFLVRADVVFSARHVLTKAVSLCEGSRGQNRIPVVAFFNTERPAVEVRVYQWGLHGWMNPPHDDVGVITIHEADSDVVAARPPLDSPQTFDTDVGDPIGILGYPFGTRGLVNQDAAGASRIYRVGPVLQQGFLSAIAPFESAGRVDRLLLDIRTAAGMSGAAVISSETGLAIGVHTSGFASEPSVLAFAVPLSAEFVATIVAHLATQSAADTGQQISSTIDIPNVRRGGER